MIFSDIQVEDVVTFDMAWLVVELTPPKTIKVTWGYSSQYMEKNPNHQPAIFGYSIIFIGEYQYDIQ